MADAHPFTGYNKSSNDANALVGNWVEERALQVETGMLRYLQWSQDAYNEESVYPNHVREKKMPTFQRVFKHSDAIDADSWTTHNRDEFQGSAKPGDLRVFHAPKQHGLRSERELARLMELAKEEPTPEPAKMVFETTNRTDFSEKDMSGLQIGARVMKTLDGGKITRDPQFLVESGIMAPSDARRLGENGKLGGGAAPDAAGIPLTFYSEKALAGEYPNTFQGGSKINDPERPFARETNFTKTMGDFTKSVVDE